MLWDIVKFKIRTTFRRSAIVTYVVVFLILLLYAYSLSHIRLPSSALYELDIVGILVLSLNFLTNSIYSSFFIQKSDVDFLYMLPIEERELEVAYSLSAFLINLLQTIIVAILLYPVISCFSVLIVLMATVMNSFSFFAFKSKRKVIASIITAWMLSSILKFPFSPFSMVFGYIYGYFILIALDVIIVFLGVRNASVEGLVNEFYKRQGLITGKPTTSISLYSSSPLMAMLKRNFNFVEIGGRMNLGTGIPYIINVRVKMYKVVAITAAIAIVVYIGFSFFSHTFVTERVNTQILLSIFEGMIAFISGLFIILFTSLSAFVNEPLWLNLSVMTPIEFARKYLLAKTLSVFAIFLPISISLILLNPEVSAGSLLIPLVYIYVASINARFYPVLMSSQIPSYDIRVLSSSLLLLPSFIPIALDAFFPIGGVIATLAFSLPFLLSKAYWEKTFEKIMTSV